MADSNNNWVYVCEKDEIDLEDVRLQFYLNGEKLQDAKISEMAFPIPKISNFPNWSFLPTITLILVVPISSPTIIGELFSIFLFFSTNNLIFKF